MADANHSHTSDSCDSDEDINAQCFVELLSKRPASDPTDHHKISEDPSPKKKTRLDDLLAEHEKETAARERLEKAKEELQADLVYNDEDKLFTSSQSLASEHKYHIEQLEVKSSVNLTHPGIKLFHKDKFCNLFSECTSLCARNFTPSASAIDKLVASTPPNMLTNLLLSKALVTCVNQLSDVDRVLLWLLNILAVHHSPVTVHSCYNNIIGILHQFQIEALSRSSTRKHTWCPSTLDILRLFVNLGADSQDLLGGAQTYSQDAISKYLTVESDGNDEHHETIKGQACGGNIQLVYKVLATALQTKPSLSKEDLNHMFYMLARVELDTNVNKSMTLETQECFSALLHCYSDSDWPAVVPSLCRQLYAVSDHHHNQFHTADLLPGTTRGSFLQVRLGYISLRSLLLPDENISDEEILNFKLSDIVNICGTKEMRVPHTLAAALRSLLESDAYKMMSAVKFLDLSVGDDLYRSTQSHKSLEHMISEVDIVIHSIKDKITAMDMAKIKDSLSKLKIKWSLALQDHPANQRSILPWLSHTGKESARKEILRDNRSMLSEDEDL